MNRILKANPPVQWVVDLAAGTIEHLSGLQIVFTPLQEPGHFEGTPRNIPTDMAAQTLSRLIRHGFDEFKAALNQHEAGRAIIVLKMR